jgi:hypothetical protein
MPLPWQEHRLRFLWHHLALALLLLVTAPLHGQTVRGELVEEGTTRRVNGAIVTLIDAHGDVAAGALSDSEGRFTLRAPSPGPYRIRAERIGFTVVSSPVLVLEGSDPIDYRMVARSEPVVLRGVDVAVRSRACQVRPQDGAVLHQVWDEARKALRGTALSGEQESLWVRRAFYERVMEPNGARLRSERVWNDSGRTGIPFATLAPEDLAREGYLRQTADTTVYYGPDAEVLLSDSFLDTHCFRLTTRTEAGVELIGLAFEPVPTQRVPDIEGVLWIDAETKLLRYVEYRYTRLPVSGGPFGGRIDLELIPSGAWIVKRWSIRMPIFVVETVIGPTGVPRHTDRLVGIKEDGGEVTQIATRAGGIADERKGALSGVVRDPWMHAPLVGATVYLSGTAHTATTGASGQFRIEALPAGSFTIGFMHPVLDSIGRPPVPVEVEVEADATNHVELTVPAHTAIVGRVLASDGAPVAGAEVRIEGGGPRGVSLPDGRFRVFGVAPGTRVIEVHYPGLAPERREVSVVEGSPSPVDLTLDIRPLECCPPAR